MAVTATTLRRGQAIRVEGDVGIILNLEHRTPGKGNALIMATVRSFSSGKTKDIRFASGDKVEIVNLDRQKLEFSYSDPSGYHFMDPNTYDTVALPEELLDVSKDFLTENMSVEVLFIEGNPVTVTMPLTVELIVTDSSDGIKGDTANNPTKPAVLETGITVQVPLFVKPGDVLKVSTEDGSYLGRA